MTRFELRPATPGDLVGLAALVNRSKTHDGVPRRTTVAALGSEFADDEFDPDADARVVELEGELVAAGRVWFHEAGTGQERAYLHGDVDPSCRGRGIGRRLLAWQIERATERLAGTTAGLPRYVRVEQYDFVADAHRLYERCGLRAARWFDEMLRPLDAPLPRIRPVDGVEIVDWPRERDAELRTVKNLAFAEHWGSAPMSEAAWAGWMTGAHTRLDLSVAALDRATGEIVGHCICTHAPADEAATGRREGWIDNVGTVPAARGKGLAPLMIAICLQRFAEHGFTHAALVVDADHPSNAPEIYRRLGFTTAFRQLHREAALP